MNEGDETVARIAHETLIRLESGRRYFRRHRFDQIAANTPHSLHREEAGDAVQEELGGLPVEGRGIGLLRLRKFQPPNQR